MGEKIQFEDRNKEKNEPIRGECFICMDDESAGELVQLACSHIFHKGCLGRQIAARWAGKRVTFNYLHCALCREGIDTTNRSLRRTIQSHRELKTAVESVCQRRAEEDGTATPTARDLSDMAAYICSNCAAPYCGGRVSCGADAVEEEGGGGGEVGTCGEGAAAAAERLCERCAFSKTRKTVVDQEEDPAKCDHRCLAHGARHAVFKCDFCCAVATYDCSGVHFCDPCHGGGGWRGRNNDERTQKCLGRPGDRCPLGKRHPKNGARESRNFVIGCAKCLGIEGREAFASRGTEQQWARDRAKAKKRKEAVVLKTGLLQLRVTVREWTLSGLTRVEVDKLMRIELSEHSLTATPPTAPLSDSRGGGGGSEKDAAKKKRQWWSLKDVDFSRPARQICTRIGDGDSGGANGLEVRVGGGETLRLHAATEAEAESWMAMLNDAVVKSEERHENQEGRS